MYRSLCTRLIHNNNITNVSKYSLGYNINQSRSFCSNDKSNRKNDEEEVKVDLSKVPTPEQVVELDNTPVDDRAGNNFDINRFAFREEPKQKYGGQRKRFNRPQRCRETGLEHGGRLKISLTGRQIENSAFIPLKMRDEMHKLHKEDPNGKGSLIRLAQKTGLRVKKIQGIIKCRDVELKLEKKLGHKLDYTLDEMARKYFGERSSFLGEFDHVEVQARINNLASMDWQYTVDPAEETKNAFLDNNNSLLEGESLAGFFDTWKKPNHYNHEKPFKKDAKFAYFKIRKEKKRKPLI